MLPTFLWRIRGMLWWHFGYFLGSTMQALLWASGGYVYHTNVLKKIGNESKKEICIDDFSYEN
jgi:hypothetical protein